MTAHLSVTRDKDERIAPRERILTAVSDLFCRYGIRAVGAEAIAEAAGTNKMTVYRHFQSKDELVAEYLRQSAKAADACWDQLEQLHPGDELAQLGTWFREVAEHVADSDQRGCALANAAIELPEKTHPARRVIEEYKSAVRSRLVRLAQTAGLREPEMLPDELFLLLEGARGSAQSGGTDGLRSRLGRMGRKPMGAQPRPQHVLLPGCAG